jgi:integrase
MGRARERLYLRGKVWWTWGYSSDGTKYQESTHQRDPRAAELAAREIERRYAADPTHKSRSKVTLRFALEAVIDYQAAAGRAYTTVLSTTHNAEHLVGGLGIETPLSSITLDDTTRYLRWRLEQGAHRHTIKKELGKLTQAIRRVTKLGLYVPLVAPEHLIPDELGKCYEPRKRWLPRDEYEALIRELTPVPPGRLQIVPAEKRKRAPRENRADYVIAWCNLGLRASELFTVCPGDYNHERRELRVRGTKTEGADRLVPVNEAAAAVLVRRCDPSKYRPDELARLVVLIELRTLGKPGEFTKAHDRELRRMPRPFPDWSDGSCVRDLERKCKKAGIVKVTPNDFRRTFCSWLCQAGVPERVCAELLGHGSTVMVRAVYGHLDRGSLQRAVALI